MFIDYVCLVQMHIYIIQLSWPNVSPQLSPILFSFLSHILIRAGLDCIDGSRRSLVVASVGPSGRLLLSAPFLQCALVSAIVLTLDCRQVFYNLSLLSFDAKCDLSLLGHIKAKYSTIYLF